MNPEENLDERVDELPTDTGVSPDLEEFDVGQGSEIVPTPMPMDTPSTPTEHTPNLEAYLPIQPVQDSIDDLHAGILQVSREITELTGHRDLENRMYEDLSRLREKDDVTRSLPILRSIIQVIDHVIELKVGEHDLRIVLTHIEDELTELLARQGVDRIVRAEIDGFDRTVQKSIGQLDATALMDIQIVSPGYTYGDRVLRPQSVLVRPDPRHESDRLMPQEEELAENDR